jgi:hypothetical protein
MTKKILNLSSVIQATRIKEILDQNGIPHIIRSYQDTAYDGLFQHQYGWGILEADERYEERILDLVKDSLSDN